MKTATTNWQLKMERPVIVALYRLLARWLGERYRMLLLTSTGRKSRRKHTVPLVYMPVEGGFAVMASNIGLDGHPGWFLNLQGNPHAHIQIGNTKMAVRADQAPAEDRERLWGDWIKINPGYQRFQDKTARKFPVVILKPGA